MFIFARKQVSKKIYSYFPNNSGKFLQKPENTHFNQNLFYFLILGEPPARDFSRRISTDASQPKLIVLPLSPNQPTTSTPPKSFSGSPPSRLVSPPQRAPPPYPHPPPPPAPVIYNNGPPKMVRKQDNKPD